MNVTAFARFKSNFLRKFFYCCQALSVYTDIISLIFRHVCLRVAHFFECCVIIYQWKKAFQEVVIIEFGLKKSIPKWTAYYVSSFLWTITLIYYLHNIICLLLNVHFLFAERAREGHTNTLTYTHKKKERASLGN